MKTAEEILIKYETYVTMGQPHNSTPIFLKENVLAAMEEYAKPYKSLSDARGELITKLSMNAPIEQLSDLKLHYESIKTLCTRIEQLEKELEGEG